MAACDGKPIEGAAPYAGAVHPLIVYAEPVEEARYESEHLPRPLYNSFMDINLRSNFVAVGNGTAEAWPGPIQLVVCITLNKSKKVGSCGMYESTNGAVNEMTRYQSSVTLRLVAARTGKVLQKKVITQAAPACKKTYAYIATGDGPWWDVTEVPAEAINAWAVSMSSKPVH